MELNKNDLQTLTNRRNELHAVVHLKATSAYEKFAALFTSSFLLNKKAADFRLRYSEFIFPRAPIAHSIIIQPYAGNNFTALALRNLTLAQLKDDIQDIIIHGSIADDTACHYSDFDCLIIFNDDVISSPVRLSRASSKLRKWQKLMLQTDILQHHGWFVALTSDFNCWHQTYLPVEVLSYSKSLLHEQEYELKVFTHPTEDFKSPFLKLCSELMITTPAAISKMNSYEIKTFISRFFLMPALYYQAKYKKGIYKRDSFTLVKNDFSEKLWEPVTNLSKLRSVWQQQYSSLTTGLIKSIYLWPSNIKKFAYPSAPKSITTEVMKNLPAIKSLLQAMKKKVD